MLVRVVVNRAIEKDKTHQKTVGKFCCRVLEPLHSCVNVDSMANGSVHVSYHVEAQSIGLLIKRTQYV